VEVNRIFIMIETKDLFRVEIRPKHELVMVKRDYHSERGEYDGFRYHADDSLKSPRSSGSSPVYDETRVQTGWEITLCYLNTLKMSATAQNYAEHMSKMACSEKMESMVSIKPQTYYTRMYIPEKFWEEQKRFVIPVEDWDDKSPVFIFASFRRMQNCVDETFTNLKEITFTLDHKGRFNNSFEITVQDENSDFLNDEQIDSFFKQ
jgi:hypothetical protein